MANLSQHTPIRQEDNLLDTSLIQIIDGIARVDSRLIARELNVEHKPMLNNLIVKYSDKFKPLGELYFKNAIEGQATSRYVLLNEDQAYLLLTLVRNSEHSVPLKLRLVEEFRDARQLILPSSIEDLIIMQAQSVKDLKQDFKMLEHKQDDLENSLCIDGYERGQLKTLVDGIEQASPTLHWRNVWRAFNERFGLASYHSLPKKRFLEGKEFLALWLENESKTNTLPDSKGVFDDNKSN